jgi:hypothetical protein
VTLALLRLPLQVASAGACERNWSSFEFIHDKRRNRLTPGLAEDLVFIFSNMQLLRREEKKRKLGEEGCVPWQWFPEADSDDEKAEAEEVEAEWKAAQAAEAADEDAAGPSS